MFNEDVIEFFREIYYDFADLLKLTWYANRYSLNRNFNGVKTYLGQYIDWLKRSSIMLAILAAFCFAPYGWIPFVLVMSIPTVGLILMLYISWPRPNESIVTIEYEPDFRVGGERKMWISVPRKYLNDRKAPIYRVSFPHQPTTMSSISLGDITDRMRGVLWS